MTSHDAGQRFYALLDDDDPVALQAVIDDGLDVNEQDDSDSLRTPLMWAAREGGPHAVRLLLQAGARLDTTDGDGWMALHHLAAADEPNLQSLELLLAAGADPNAATEDFGDDDAVEDEESEETEDAPDEADSLDETALIRAADPLAETALILAASFGNDAVLARLLEAGGVPRLEQLRAAVSNGVGPCARRMMAVFPNAALGDVLAVWPNDPLDARPRAAFEKALAERDAGTLERGLPSGDAPRARGVRL